MGERRKIILPLVVKMNSLHIKNKKKITSVQKKIFLFIQITVRKNK